MMAGGAARPGAPARPDRRQTGERAVTTGTSDGRRRVLLTGAGGEIGRAFRAYADGRYDMRLAGRSEIELLDGERAEVISLDIADPDACQAACQGIDTIIHLAADRRMYAEFYDSLLENNIKGPYNIYRAAKDQGCRRVIFASSVNAVAGAPTRHQAQTDEVPTPLNIYGASKVWGEALGAYFNAVEGLGGFAVRIGAFKTEFDEMGGDPIPVRHVSMLTSPRDLCQLLVRCVETDVEGFHIVHGLSNNAMPFMDIESTKRLLGWEPEDDGFALYGNRFSTID
jgi:NAD+ dependent glucose-6-phosphate dehydrogenase